MALVIDANMRLFAERLHISSSRMVNDYGLATVEEIIEKETERGNTHAVKHAREYYHSPEKLIRLFKLADVENRFVLLRKMNDRTRKKVLPLLNQDDLRMGLHFFTQEKLLAMLMESNIEELVNVVQEAFSLDEIVMMYTEDDLAAFFMNRELEKNDVIEQIKLMPPEAMKTFIENVTGMPSDQTNPDDLTQQISELPDDKFHKFMASIDSGSQRQLTFQLVKTKPKYLTLFGNESYCNMLNTLVKPEMIKPMIVMNHDSLVNMISELPGDFMAVVAAQVDTKKFAKFLQKGHMKGIEDAWML